ncbi:MULTISPECIES: alpha/beta hydrolase [Exiguobacterium]|uniref:Alpha/beta hydrolase n=1 Tax=Exiguobacterium antarcticum TaxID=132920 RepID=A0ABT6R5J7_9BACL|nr:MULTISPECIES: alpha/beta hydrolase [Exiguobacterium]AFS70680.1 Abhydrolase domain-containing protein [Exiguobacterium antarcticum B7]MCT4780428.1 alpha/beta hydrolase [Exiguobacterium soli]MDI3236207.1 alpha/beta hydrolase [Exiguobacterium antarcticum]
MRKRTKIGLGVLGSGMLAASYYFYEMAIATHPKPFLTNNRDLSDEMVRLMQPGQTWIKEQPLEQIEVQARDGLTLRGHYLPPLVPSNRTVILVHGYGGVGTDLAGFAYLYHQAGFHVMMPDNRGHGKSEGHYIGFGWHDREDCLCWTEYLIERLGQDSAIFLHGVSMGGATVLMTSGEVLPAQIKGIISDCAYTSVNAVLAYQMKRMYRLPHFPFLAMTSVLTKLKAGYFFSEASALKQVKRATVPILFLHGGADTFVPTSMVYELYEACPTEKELVVIPNASHAMAYFEDPDTYDTVVERFVRRILTEA